MILQKFTVKSLINLYGKKECAKQGGGFKHFLFLGSTPLCYVIKIVLENKVIYASNLSANVLLCGPPVVYSELMLVKNHLKLIRGF